MDQSTRDADIRVSTRMFLRKLPIDIMVFLLSPIVLLFIPKSWDRMPDDNRFLRYFQDWKYGINGDPMWVNPGLSDHPATPDAARSWYWRWRWLLRNANVFDHDHGVSAEDIVRIDWSGNAYVGNRPLVEGDLAIHVWDKNGTRFWAYYSVHINPSHPDMCKRSYIGWKLQEVLHNYLRTGKFVGEGNPLMQAVFSINPYMGYSTE